MKDDQEDFELIGRYLRDELSGDELARFRDRMLRDPEFAQDVEQAQFLVQGIEYTEVEKRVGAALNIARANERARLQLQKRVVWVAAASVVLGVIVSVFLLHKPADALYSERRMHVSEDLYSAAPIENAYGRISASDSVVSAYLRHHYHDCTREFQRTENPSALATFCAADAYLMLGQTTDAIHYFQKANQLASEESDVEALSAYYADMLSLERLDLSTAEVVLKEMHPDGKLHPNVELLLALKYIKARRFDEADSIVSRMKNADWEFRTQVKLLKWIH